MKLPKSTLTLAIVALVVALVMLARAVLSLRLPVQDPGQPARLLGDPRAAVKVVEYTDFQCPACAAASEILHTEFGQANGDISVELKYFPLAMHKNARRAAVVAECAFAQGKFWPMTNILFRSQKSWAEMDSTDDYFLSLARGLGLDEAGMARCMADPAVLVKIDKDVEEGKGLGVQATPTFFVNGKMVVGGKNFQQELKGAKK